jgi:hypothetical protein
MTGTLRPGPAASFLETSRCHPSKELIAAVITTDPKAKQEGQAKWEIMIEQFLADGYVYIVIELTTENSECITHTANRTFHLVLPRMFTGRFFGRRILYQV